MPVRNSIADRINETRIILKTALIRNNKVPKDIEKRFHLTHPTVSGVLQRLEAKDFVVLEPDRDDRRCKRIRLTERARQCDAAVGQAFETLERVMCSGMSDEEQQTLLRLLDLAADNLHATQEMEVSDL